MAQKYHILKEYANGVMDEKGRFYPYRVSYAVTLAAKRGIRYYVRSIQQTLNKAGASAASSVYFDMTIKGVTTTVSIISMPETFAASNDCSTVNTEVHLLGDLNTAVTEQGTTTAVVIYAEVMEDEGEYSG